MPDTQISELLVRINEWLREPDYAENFSLTDMADWMNRRPLALMGQATAALSGYIIVPREPTGRMICAALDDGDKRGRSQTCGDVYRAMIQAAPPVQEDGGLGGWQISSR